MTNSNFHGQYSVVVTSDIYIWIGITTTSSPTNNHHMNYGRRRRYCGWLLVVFASVRTNYKGISSIAPAQIMCESNSLPMSTIVCVNRTVSKCSALLANHMIRWRTIMNALLSCVDWVTKANHDGNKYG